MKGLRTHIYKLSIVLFFGLIPAVLIQFFCRDPVSRRIHVRNFRYGKDPSVIRCNRGDTLHLTFSTDDTGHSFFLEEFGIDVKVSPAVKNVVVFNPADPTIKPVVEDEVILIAKHPGTMNYLVSKSNYRCHVWCGPMHAFEQGKLVIFPNTLMTFSLGSLAGMLFIFFRSIFRIQTLKNESEDERRGYRELTKKSGIAEKIIKSRWPQIIMVLFAMLMIYIVILTAVFGTKVSGRNLGVLLMWSVWLFVLVAILTPAAGRVWCTICPLPFFGDLFQRGSFFTPRKGRTNGLNNKFSGLSLKWPSRLCNSWLRLFVFMVLATFSTTLVAVPRISGIVVLLLLLIPTLMSMVWELRSFCRYVCPVSVFVSPFSGLSPVALRNRSQNVCDNCKGHFCQTGSSEGWACPYGLNVAELDQNADCGLCLECTRSCPYNNITIYKRPFASENGPRDMSQAWLAISIFTVSVIYSILYLGHWPAVRDYVNIIDKHNWGLFGIYSIILWSATLAIMPGLLYLTALISKRWSGTEATIRNIFMASAGSLLPLGLMIWIAFVTPMLFVNKTFIIQSASDPFGWGWDFFGTANIPWKQFLPQVVPYLQSALILTGFYFSLKKIRNYGISFQMDHSRPQKFILPMIIFIFSFSVAMIIFFTN